MFYRTLENFREEIKNGALLLIKKIQKYRPKIVVFNGRGIYAKFIGNNKTETFTYEITVKNNKKETLNMLLKDQYPLSSIKEIEVKLEESNGAEVNEELGSVNWKISLKPGESKKYRFSYKVTYPKDKKLANLR